MNNHNSETNITYPAELLAEDWEFKTIKARGSPFRYKSELVEVMAEEQAFGWLLLEKVDDRTIRVKRQRRFREYDHEVESEIDPYRTYYRTLNDTLIEISVWMLGGTFILTWLLSSCLG